MTLDPKTASSLTEDQAIGVARFAVEKRAPGWQAFEVLLRMADELNERRQQWIKARRTVEVRMNESLRRRHNGGK